MVALLGQTLAPRLYLFFDGRWAPADANGDVTAVLLCPFGRRRGNTGLSLNQHHFRVATSRGGSVCDLC